MSWTYIYDTTTGRLISETSLPVPDVSRRGLALHVRETRRTADEMWDDATRQFVPRPPPRTRSERMADDPAVAAILGKLTPEDQTRLRQAIDQ